MKLTKERNISMQCPVLNEALRYAQYEEKNPHLSPSITMNCLFEYDKSIGVK